MGRGGGTARAGDSLSGFINKSEDTQSRKGRGCKQRAVVGVGNGAG